MASIIRIKRSATSGNPGTLGAGELAYSSLADNGSNGGDRLYIGEGTETNGDAANHLVIGGKYFTDKLDHALGTLTASSALLVDANKKVDNLKVDNLDLDGNTISSTDTNGNVTINPNGTGTVDVSTSKIVNVTDPTADQDAATKKAACILHQGTDQANPCSPADQLLQDEADSQEMPPPAGSWLKTRCCCHQQHVEWLIGGCSAREIQNCRNAKKIARKNRFPSAPGTRNKNV